MVLVIMLSSLTVGCLHLILEQSYCFALVFYHQDRKAKISLYIMHCKLQFLLQCHTQHISVWRNLKSDRLSVSERGKVSRVSVGVHRQCTRTFFYTFYTSHTVSSGSGYDCKSVLCPHSKPHQQPFESQANRLLDCYVPRFYT